MSLFTHEARQLKFDVLREVSKRKFEGKIDEDTIDEIANLLIPTNKAKFRCCVYKEREIIRERTRLALGKKPNIVRQDYSSPRQIIHVLEAACDGCSIHKITVTDNCRKCMAKACMASCNFRAISMGEKRAVIDYQKCKECGACARNCPYHAIVVTERPCKSACPVDAIKWNEDGIAIIDDTKCINCGRCLAACPFGAIEDISWIIPVIYDITSGKKMIAMIAPSVQGQFDNYSLNQIKEAILKLGFSDVVEVAIGADMVAVEEYKELKEHKANKVPMTTSCCPAFVNMARIHFPTIYENNMSTMVSPMIATAQMLKKQDPECGVVFIGPCIAKKQEAIDTAVDYVLTVEELAAMLISKQIYLGDIKDEHNNIEPSVHGRNFAQGGGVSKAVAEVAKSLGDEEITAYYADGANECKKQLLLMKVGRFNFDILEGIAKRRGLLLSQGQYDVEKAEILLLKEFKEGLIVKTIVDELC